MMMANAKPYAPDETVYDVDMSFESTLTYKVWITSPYGDTVIDWGDGTTTIDPKNGTAHSVSHQYATIGVYTVRIHSADRQKAYSIAHDNESTALCVTRVRQLGDNIHKAVEMFSRCRNLAKVDSGVKVRKLVDKRCSAIFSQCGNNTAGLYVNDDFTVSDDVRDCYGIFFYAKVLNLPKAFRVPSACTSIRSFAHTATSMTGDITNIFPEAWASKTATINIGYAFANCRKLTGTAPAHLLWNAPNITWSDTTDCFAGCTGLTNYNEIPASWGGGGA
jgi:hypothetical protein